MARYAIVLLIVTLRAPTRLLANPPEPVPTPSTLPSAPVPPAGDNTTPRLETTDSIPLGTTITLQNWQSFKQFMPDCMTAFFEGKYFWKMPADVSMEIGATVDYPLPKNYIEATEKYASQVKLIELPDGGLTLINYHGGIPFPNPQEPHKGWKVLANLWYRYMPHLIAQTYGYTCGLDALGASSCITLQYVLRQFAFNTDPGFAATGGYADIFFTNWFMVLEPEQQKYTTTLSIVYADPARAEDSYVFLPSLRRYQTLSALARCSETAGTDATHDDYQFGFDSNITQLKVDYVAHRKILSLADVVLPKESFPAGFDLPLGWPRPSMGKWQLRDVDEISISKLPSSGGSVCYSKRVLYIDSHFYTPLWVENYGRDLKPARFHAIFPHTVEAPGIGPVNASGADVEVFWNLVQNHATFTVEPALNGKHYINEQAPKEFDDLPRYSTPSGLNLIMR
jgi:hypothetical protein